MRSKIIQTVLPIFVLLVLTAMSLFSTVGAGSNGWIPVVGGFFNADLLGNPLLSVPLMAVCLALTLPGIFLILLKTNAIPFGRCVALFMALLAINPKWFHFSQIYPVLACIVWAQLCLLERQVFVAFMLLSGASLFYAPAIWLVPVLIMFMPFNGMPDQLRVFVTSLSGASLPHLYLLVFRWIKFDDAGVYLYHFANEAIETGTPFHYLGIPDYFMLAILCYVLIRSIVFVFSKNPMGKLGYILKMEMVMLLVLFLLAGFFYANNGEMLSSLFLLPASVLMTFYFKNSPMTNRSNIEMLLLMGATAICACYHF